MKLQLQRISAPFGPLHASFLDHVETAFPQAGRTFRPWSERGGWTSDYEVFAAVDSDCRVVSTVGRLRMRFLFRGVACDGWQLATVATRPGWRRQGLSRRLIDWVLDESEIEGHPIILFGNDSVVDFYPRFGFRRVVQWHFTDIYPVEAAKRPAVRLDIRRSDDRRFLAHHCSRALPSGRCFGARDYYSALLFHLTIQELPVYWLDREQAVVIAGHEGDRLVIHDLLPTQAFDLRAALPQLAAATATSISFGFDPKDWWPSAATLCALPSNDHLFVRGSIDPPDGAFRFPDLAQT